MNKSNIEFLGEQFRLLANLSLPDDIRECCEVLREDAHIGAYNIGWGEYQAAVWQLLDHLGVL